MKNIIRKKSNLLFICILSILILLGGYPSFAKFFYSEPPPTDSQYIINERADIIGTFISDEDPRWKMVFSLNGKCYNYYDGNLIVTSSYTISNTTPQCGIDVVIDESEETSYLSITNDINGISECYEINGITATLSLTAISTQKVLLFTKQ